MEKVISAIACCRIPINSYLPCVSDDSYGSAIYTKKQNGSAILFLEIEIKFYSEVLQHS